MGQSLRYSHNPERQGEKPLLPGLKTLVCRDWESNPRHPAHELDALTTRQQRFQQTGGVADPVDRGLQTLERTGSLR